SSPSCAAPPSTRRRSTRSSPSTRRTGTWTAWRWSIATFHARAHSSSCGGRGEDVQHARAEPLHQRAPRPRTQRAPAARLAVHGPTIRYAVLSDIHANRPALEAVLADAAGAGVGALLCLGDVVGYGADPA